MATGRHCAVCGKPAGERRVNSAFPFCSERCKLLDLGKWLAEEYRVPGGRPGDGAVLETAPNPEDES